MTIYDLKPKFQNFLRPVVRILYKIGISPNQITLLTCIFSITYSFVIYYFPNSKLILNLVPIFFFIRMALNAIDGILAKEFNLTSRLGALLNELTDVISDTFLYLAFLSQNLIEHHFLIIFSIIAILTEFAGLAALQINSPRRYDGPMGKSDRAFFISLISLLLANTNIDSNVYSILFGVAAILSVLTVINRMKKSLDFKGI